MRHIENGEGGIRTHEGVTPTTNATVSDLCSNELLGSWCVLVSPPQCPLGHFWDAVPHLHSVVVPGHHGIGVTREFADVIPAHSLFQEVGDEGTASGIQGEFIGEGIPQVLTDHIPRSGEHRVRIRLACFGVGEDQLISLWLLISVLLTPLGGELPPTLQIGG